MNILVDENIPRMTVNRLRELGHDVRDIMRAMERFQEVEWPGLLVVMRDATISTSHAGGPS